MATALLATDDANSEFVGARNPDAALSVRFYSRAVQNNVATSEAGRPIFQDITYVEIMTPGNSLNIIDTPARDDHKRRFPIQWAAFNNANGGEQATVGTPITSWPFLTKAQAEEMRAMKFLTVEMLANASDGQLQVIGMCGGMNPMVLRERAKAYLDAAKGAAPMEHLSSKLAEATKMIEAQQAQINALLQGAPTAAVDQPATRRGKKRREPHKPELVERYNALFGRRPSSAMTNESIASSLEKREKG